MSGFNRMTIVAAVDVIADFHSHSDMAVLEVQWDLNQYGISSTSKSARVADWSRIATTLNPEVMTEAGEVHLERALVDAAIRAPEHSRQKPEWKKLVAGLRFDGFELIEIEVPTGRTGLFGDPATETRYELRRMLPEDVPEIDFREAASEVERLLDELSLPVAKGHLRQALSAFQRGEWSSANGELRNFYENYLNEIADALGYSGKDDSRLRRDYLGAGVEPPFLLDEYNEWNENNQKPQYVQGLMSRMHPHGGHPGLSEEEDATFRLQVSLITARLFLRRFKQRKTV
ncbi:hypothetical protein [Salipiger abyssi]|uniref:hypothetical protein n=1 Tax=Salipiger abyssi TaxID=1250539 RepID=UPI001A8D225E|nr:hypothetical protein [Salipiger abyssi]MBN9888525.1 hypothetical protein [Salipiger abyssi]